MMTRDELWTVVGGDIAVEFTLVDGESTYRMRITRGQDGSYAAIRPSAGKGYAGSNGCFGYRKWQEHERVVGDRYVSAGHRIEPNDVDWPGALRRFGYDDLADRFPSEWVGLGDDLIPIVTKIAAQRWRHQPVPRLTDDINEIVSNTRTLIAVCDSIEDFLFIRPMSLGFAVCGIDAFHPGTRHHARRWLDFWATRLNAMPHMIEESTRRLAHAKWIESGFGFDVELSWRTRNFMRKEIGIEADDQLAAHRIEIGRRLNIPPFMFGA